MKRLYYLPSFERRGWGWLIALLLLFCGTVALHAQQLTVTSFKVDEEETAAVKFEKRDASKKICPLVIVQVAIEGVTFEGDVIAVEQKNGDYWVYMSDEATFLEIHAKGYVSPEFDIKKEYPNGLVSAKTYRLVIEKPVTGDEPKGTIIVSSNISEGDFYVDGVKQVSGAPPYQYSGGEGLHKVTIKAPGYNDETAEFEIKLGKKLKYQLKMKAEGSFQFDGVSYEMVNIDGAGSFLMGSAESLDKTYAYTGLRSYKIGKTEVTQALWKAVMGSNPSIHQGENLPVENVSWDDCQVFISKLNERSGMHFRLPTEAEWEYAARCGGQYKAEDFSGDGSLSNVAHVGGQTIDVASKRPNAWGLYDMSGNVAEWCEDWWESYSSKKFSSGAKKKSFFRVVRGGSYADGDKTERDKLRCYYRSKQKPENTKPSIGLRLAQDL